ncbi:hypothetical protein [Streptomyces sp. A1499]|uniref:hypothetical protein n=1 Tax=Streptomyces sp. A1499 TaxID=2563104 RepID=UPI001F108FEA|nr:hypothetical protein [Streptomyces sp. A1499]
MIRTCLAEHEAWSNSAAAARAGLVRSLLSDAARVDTDEAPRVLGYNRRRTHEAVVVWSDSPHPGSTLQAAVIEVLRARGATATLTVPVAAGRLWAWGAVSMDGTREHSPPDAVTPTLTKQRLQAAFGIPAAGVAGFARSHGEARRAERVQRLRREVGRVDRTTTAYADVAAVALMATDLEGPATSYAGSSAPLPNPARPWRHCAPRSPTT